MKLNLGCGADHRAGYVNVDLFTKADRQDNIVTLATFEDASADEILAHHSLEHLSYADGRAALARWRAVLKPGGKLVVVVPDVIMMMRLFLEFWDRRDPRLWDFRAKTIWGNQNHGGEFHRWGFDEAHLREALESAGFVDITIERVLGLDFDFGNIEGACFQATARRPA